MHAYDISLGDWRDGEPDRDGDGWCFGLPPGLAPEAWPIDPNGGHPLVHGFTLRLPEDYRIHGPQVVALAFFATPADDNDGGGRAWRQDVHDIIAVPAAEPPADPALRAWWDRARAVHPRTARMTDILDYHYAVVLLTEAEWTAPCTRPPGAIDDPRHAEARRPGWLGAGSAAAYAAFERKAPPPIAGDPFLTHRPLALTPRANDPNAGKAPRETFDDSPTETGYQSHFYWEDGIIEVAKWREHDWAKDHAQNHLGGTMRPIQAMPEFSPFYIGFEEEMGGFNFGSGNAQLDFRDMRFDWACG